MLYVISGCSGGGKSTLIDALSERGFNTSKEPGRQIVREEQTSGGEALPWNNPVAFSERCAELSEQLHDSATQSGKVVFFDRLVVTYARAGYSILLLPKSSMAKRTNVVLQHVE